MVVAPTKRRFTADEFLRMAQVGILCEDDRLELIDGEVVEMRANGLPHTAAVSCATRALVMAASETAIVQPQGPVRLDLYYEPEPDLVLPEATRRLLRLAPSCPRGCPCGHRGRRL